jgi:quercetin dioxygenase-like cupin family protein
MVMNAVDPNKPCSSVAENTFQRFDLEGLNFKIIVDGNNTGGEYSLIEMQFPKGKEREIPLHVHDKENLIVYVLEGEFVFTDGKDETICNTNSVIKLDKDVAHSYRKTVEDNGRLLIMYSPAGFENFFKDLQSIHENESITLDLVDPVVMHMLEKKYATRFVFN